MQPSPFIRTCAVILSLISALSAYETPKSFPEGYILHLDSFLQLDDSTSHLSIAYFGQSIISSTGVKNWWPDSITQYVRNIYPKATITAVNAAISGCDAECMTKDNIVRTKLVPLAPDLIIIAIYFHFEEQMEALLQQIKSELPKAMIAMVDFHYSSPKDTHWSVAGQKSEVPWEDALSYDYLPWLCRKYQVAYMDIRKPWIQYMNDFNGGADNLTNPSDGIHLNDRGQWLMTQFVKRFFDMAIIDEFAPRIGQVTNTEKIVYVTYATHIGMNPQSTIDTMAYSIDSGKTTFGTPVFDEMTQTVCLPLRAPLDTTVKHTLSLRPSRISDKAGNRISATNAQLIKPVPRTDGWKSVDIGRVSAPGQTVAGAATDELLISGGGDLTSPMGCAWSKQADPCAPRWRWRNECQFYSVRTTGDFSITTHISNIDKLNDYSQAGILIRQDTKNYLSPMVALGTYRNNGGIIDFVKRTTVDSIGYVVPRMKSSARWLRMTRKGTSFEAFISETGTSWTSIGTASTSMFSEAQTGLFVTGNDYGGGPYTATFSNIAIEGAPAVSVAAPNILCRSPAPRFTIRGNRILLRQAGTSEPLTVSITNLQGRVVFRCTTRLQFVTLPPRAPGVYTVQVNDATGGADLSTGRHRILVY